MELQPVEDDPLAEAEAAHKKQAAGNMVRGGFMVVAGAPVVMALGAAGLFELIPALATPPIPYVLVGVGVLDLIAGAALIMLGRSKGAAV